MTLRYNLLEESLIRTRLVAGGQPQAFSLPGLLVALGQDAVRDFPALRPHQRHPWHAFLVQLAAIALHRAGRSEPFDNEAAWKNALLDLTPEDPDGAAWCLITPHDRPAFMQAPVPGGSLEDWSDDRPTPDSLDILVTSKNHDLKLGRIRSAGKDDWIFSLVSLQTQAPFPGSGNYGVSRMNGGSSSRPGLGIDPGGDIGKRWRRDVGVSLDCRANILAEIDFKDKFGVALLWVLPWDGENGLSFSQLEPYYVEICRRVRLVEKSSRIFALRTTTKGPRVAKDEAKSRKGNTGDIWTPVHAVEGKSLGVSSRGFDYERMAMLAFGSEYRKSPAQIVNRTDDGERLELVAQAIAGGQSTTDGYHERRIVISPSARKLILGKQTNRLAKLSEERVYAVAQIAYLLKNSILTLLDGGKRRDNPRDIPDSLSKKAVKLATAFEQREDARFFDALNDEIESDKPEEVRMQWLLSMADSAEAILKKAFTAGPQCGEQRYRAQAAALSRFHGGLRSPKTLPDLADHLRQQSINKELSHDQQ
ncbi:type I-E CRISPR-associated protein Cse1/CasA [Rhodocyclus purpureus]|uniref:type I-E CRISPR-associated protein Cse1/CasA n=1 Tax=Rhodocyclus purpureus TaxID=1067 RepID=UPI001912B462|nr:type I-E CRISPR-associated protein Cse1/CasA [Rhodocyclus purpureus]